MSDSKDVPTFPVKAPDGETIKVPDLPGLGERYHPTAPAVPRNHPAPQEGHQVVSPPKTNALNEVESAISRGAQRIWNDVAGDDINTLNDPHASAAMKTLAAADLITAVVPGEGEAKEALEVAGKEVVKDAAASPVARKIALAVLTHVRDMTKGFYGQIRTLGVELFEKLRSPRGQGIVAADAAVVIALDKLYDAGTNLLKDHRPTYLGPDRSEHRISDGYAMTGKVEIEGAYIVQRSLNGGRQAWYSQAQLEAHMTNASAFLDLMNAAKRGSLVTITYSGAFSVQVFRELPAYVIANSRHVMQDGFHSEGRLEDIGAGEIAQVSPHHPPRIFSRESLLQQSANPSYMERTIAAAITSRCDVTIECKDGRVFIAPMDRSNVHRQQRGR